MADVFNKHTSVLNLERSIETYINRILKSKGGQTSGGTVSMDGYRSSYSAIKNRLDSARAAAAEKEEAERTDSEKNLIEGSVNLENNDNIQEALAKIEWMLGNCVTYSDLSAGGVVIPDSSEQGSGQSSIVANTDEVIDDLFGNVADTGDVIDDLFGDNTGDNTGNNTGDNTGNNTGDNTGDNNGDNGPDIADTGDVIDDLFGGN